MSRCRGGDVDLDPHSTSCETHLGQQRARVLERLGECVDGAVVVLVDCLEKLRWSGGRRARAPRGHASVRRSLVRRSSRRVAGGGAKRKRKRRRSLDYRAMQRGGGGGSKRTSATIPRPRLLPDARRASSRKASCSPASVPSRARAARNGGSAPKASARSAISDASSTCSTVTRHT